MIKHYFVLNEKNEIVYHTFGKKRGNARAFNALMQNMNYTLVGPIHTQDSKANGHNYGVTYHCNEVNENIIKKLTDLAKKMQMPCIKPYDLANWQKLIQEYNNTL